MTTTISKLSGALAVVLPGTALPVIGMMVGFLVLDHGTAMMADEDVRAREEASVAVAKLRHDGCHLVEIDVRRRSAFDCHGVRVWHGRTVTDAWQAGGEMTP